MNFKILSISLGVTVCAAISGYFYGSEVTDTKWQAKTQQAINEAVSEARADEKAKQEKVNAAIQIQADSLRNINDRLQRDLIGLQHRESRRDMSRDSQINCKGSSGADLAKRDAEFLARFASRAAEQSAALKACYDYADSLQD